MKDFYTDLAYADSRRKRLDALFYPAASKEGRFVPLERSEGSINVQRSMHVDCIVASPKGGSITVEEKIVRWPGYSYTSITIETHSNLEKTGGSDIGDGWIVTSSADYLLYAFDQPDDRLLVWVFDLPLLREWFLESYTQYRITDSNNRFYTTRCRIVALEDIPSSCVLLRDRLV